MEKDVRDKAVNEIIEDSGLPKERIDSIKQAKFIVDNFLKVGEKIKVRGLEYVIGEVNPGGDGVMPCFAAELCGYHTGFDNTDGGE